MSGHWTYLTPIGIGSIVGIVVLFLIRLQLERQGQQQKDLTKASPTKIAQ